MKLSYEDHDTITVLKISGDLTADQVDPFRRSCLDRFEAGIRHVVLNMEHLTFIDSAGLEVLLWVIDAAAERGGQLRLIRPDHTVSKILEISRLDRRFDIHDSIESAPPVLSLRWRSSCCCRIPSLSAEIRFEAVIDGTLPKLASRST